MFRPFFIYINIFFARQWLTVKDRHATFERPSCSSQGKFVFMQKTPLPNLTCVSPAGDVTFHVWFGYVGCEGAPLPFYISWPLYSSYSKCKLYGIEALPMCGKTPLRVHFYSAIACHRKNASINTLLAFSNLISTSCKSHRITPRRTSLIIRNTIDKKKKKGLCFTFLLGLNSSPVVYIVKGRTLLSYGTHTMHMSLQNTHCARTHTHTCTHTHTIDALAKYSWLRFATPKTMKTYDCCVTLRVWLTATVFSTIMSSRYWSKSTSTVLDLRPEVRHIIM